MIHLTLNGKHAQELRILCLGSHSDDIEIGCGGTILRLAEQYPNCVLHWVVFSADGVRIAEAQRAGALFAGPRMANTHRAAARSAGPASLVGPSVKAFPDGFMPAVSGEVKQVFEELK